MERLDTGGFEGGCVARCAGGCAAGCLPGRAPDRMAGHMVHHMVTLDPPYGGGIAAAEPRRHLIPTRQGPSAGCMGTGDGPGDRQGRTPRGTEKNRAEGARDALRVRARTLTLAAAAGAGPGAGQDSLLRIRGAVEQASDVVRRVWDTVAGAVSVRNALIVAAAAVVVCVLWTATRCLATRAALTPARRVRLMALPTESFDPAPEEVDRYAAQLSRSRRTVRAALTRPAQAVRVRLDSVGDGRAVYRIEGLDDAASILRLTGYREVELRPADAIDEEGMRSLSGVAAVGVDEDTAAGAEDSHRDPAGDQSAAVDAPGEGTGDDPDAPAGRRLPPGQEGHRR